MVTSLGDAQIYDHLLKIFTASEQRRLGDVDSKADARIPELLFDSVAAVYPDNVAA